MYHRTYLRHITNDVTLLRRIMREKTSHLPKDHEIRVKLGRTIQRLKDIRANSKRRKAYES